MKVLVPIKKVIDYRVKIRVKPDGSGVDKSNVKMSMNPFDEIAVEQAVRWKEQGIASEVVVTSIGDSSSQEILRQALAMGADRAILVKYADPMIPLQVAQILQALAMQELVSVTILGKQAIDDDSNQVGQMLSGLLGWSQATFASKISKVENKLHVTREVDGGLETLAIELPAVITTDLRLNEPRFASLPNIMKAKAKPLSMITLDELGVELPPSGLKLIHVEPPVEREKGVKVNTIKELMTILKEKGLLP